MQDTARRWLPAAIIFTGVGYIVTAPNEPLALSHLFKAVPMVLTILYATALLPADREPVHILLPVGLAFSLVGDVTLQWFLVGLTAFLLAHLCYVAGFLSRVRVTTARIAAAAPLALFGFLVGVELLAAVRASGDTELLLPVAAYIVVILAMAWAAILTGNWWAVVGSLLFVASDTVLAWNMFVEPLPYRDVLVMTTYYGAQLFIARSVADFE